MRTLIYGLGNNFQRNEKYILKHYENPVFGDGNAARVKEYHDRTGRDVVTWEELDPKDETIGKIVLTPIDGIPDIAGRLHRKGFAYDKIRVLVYEQELARNLTGEFSYRMRFFGQGGDDAVLMFLFKQLQIPIKDVCYLEIGTNDPMLYNNTYNFYRAGARGIIVDPMPASQYLASLVRPEDHFVRVAVSGDPYDAGKKITFYIGASSQASSVDRALAGSIVEEIEAELVDVNYLMALEDRTPELLVIDAEGQDEAILRSLDYSRYKPMVIEAEVNKTDDEQELEQFIIDKGYFIYARTIANTFFVRKEQKYLLDRWFCQIGE